MARDITFRFRAQGLDQVRSEVSNTVRFISKIRSELQKSGASSPVQNKAGIEVARLDSILQATVKRYDQLTASLNATRDAQFALTQQQTKAAQQGRNIPQQLRSPTGQFTGQTQQSLQAEESRLLNQMDLENLTTLGKVRNARQRILDISKEEVDVIRILREINMENRAGARGDTPSRTTGFRATSTTNPEAISTEATNELIVTYDRLKTSIGHLKQVQDEFKDSLTDYGAYQNQIDAAEKEKASLVEQAKEIERLRIAYLQLTDAIDTYDARVKAGEAKAGAKGIGIKVLGKQKFIDRDDAANRARQLAVELTEKSALSLRNAAVAAKEFGASSEDALARYIGGLRKAIDAANLGGVIKIGEEALSTAAEERIVALQEQIDASNDVLGNVRQQLRKDYPKGTGDEIFTNWEKAQAGITKYNKALRENTELLDEAKRKSQPRRDAGAREALGIRSPGSAGKKQTPEGELAAEKHINDLYEKRRKIKYDLKIATDNEADAIRQLGELQEGQQLGLLKPGQRSSIAELVDQQAASAKEIAALESRGFVDELEKAIPGLTDQFETIREAVTDFERALDSSVGDGQVKKVRNLKRQLESINKELEDVNLSADVRDEKTATRDQREVEVAAAEQPLIDAIVNEPELNAKAQRIYEMVNGVIKRLKTENKEGIPIVPDESDLIGKLGTVDKILFETFSGLKRRFITTFQFILSGSIIFGIQRVAREFVQAAIEVERTFADIGTVINNTSKNLDNFDKTVRLENLRRSVLGLANELNVLPAEANEAAYQMVARFQSVEAALIATKAQLLAVKVSTADQSEVLRALTATADVYAATLDKSANAYQNQIEHAELYMEVLDNATVLQQRFGISIEDTAEGSAQLAEVFQQLGFELAEVEAAVGLVSRQTGTTGTVTADRLARSIGAIQDGRTELLELAAAEPAFNLSLPDFLGDTGGADAIRKIEDQIASGELTDSTVNAIRGIIGGRREAAFVAAFFGTSAERARAVDEMKGSAGAATERFDVLSKTVAERIQGVIVQFQSLAQNLSQLGFLTPLKAVLIMMERVLAVVNAIVQAVGGLVNALNTISFPVVGGLGDALITITSLAFAAQTLGNTFSTMSAAILTFSKTTRGAELFGAISGTLGLSQGIPKSSARGFANTFAGGASRGGFRGAVLDSGPIGVSKRGINALRLGLKNLGNSFRVGLGFTKSATGAELANTVARQGNILATTQQTSANLAQTSAMRLGASKMLLMTAATAKFALIVGGVITAFKIASSFNPFSGDNAASLYGRNTTDEEIARRTTKVDPETGDLLRTFDDSHTLRSEIAREQIQTLDEAFGVSQSWLDTIHDSTIRIGTNWIDAFTAGVTDTNSATKDLENLPEGNTFNTARKKGELYRDVLEQRAAQLRAAIESGNLSPEDAAKAIDAATQVEAKAADFDPLGDEFKDRFQQFVDQAADETMSSIERAWNSDPAAVPKVRERALSLLEDSLVAEANFIDALIEGLDLSATLGEDELLDAQGYENVLKNIVKRFEAGEVTREGALEELRGLNASAKRSIDEAVRNNDEVLEAELRDQLVTDQAKFRDIAGGFKDELRDTGSSVANAYAELGAAQEHYAILVKEAAIESGLATAKALEDARNAVDDAGKTATASYNAGALGFLDTLMIKAGADAIQQLEILKKTRTRLLSEFSNITGGELPQYDQFYTGDDADRKNEIIAEILQNRFDERAAIVDAEVQAGEIANKGAVLRGDKLVQNAIRIDALNKAIAEYKLYNRNSIEAFQLEKEVADLERQNTQEIIRRTSVRIQATVAMGDQLDEQRAAVEIAKAAMVATNKANVIEEEKIAATTAYRNAEYAYFQTVLKYTALLRGKDLDVTDPLVQARLESENAAERFANATGAIEKLEAGEAVKRANASEQQAFYDRRIEDLTFLYDTDKIGKSAYIAGLRQLQSGVDRSTRQGELIWRDIEKTIMGLVDQVEQGFNIPSEIRLPTLFEVRRAVQADEMGVNYLDNRTQEINIFVTDELDLSTAMRIIGETVDVDSARVAPGGTGITLGVV